MLSISPLASALAVIVSLTPVATQQRANLAVRRSAFPRDRPRGHRRPHSRSRDRSEESRGALCRRRDRRHLEIDEQGRDLEERLRRRSPTTRSARSRSSTATPTSSGPASGEQNNRQSSSWGGGVYRSTNGGDTWTYLGLHETRSIGPCGPGSEGSEHRVHRGGRKSVARQPGARRLQDDRRRPHVDEGAVCRSRSPARPISSWIRAISKVLYAATYQRLRKAFGFNGGGPGSAIYKTIDAGATWKKLENGIPAGDKGRIGLALALEAGCAGRHDRARHRRRHVPHGRRGRDLEADERHQSAADVLQQADHRPEQRSADLAAWHVHSEERGWRRDLRRGADLAGLRRRPEDRSSRAARRSANSSHI